MLYEVNDGSRSLQPVRSAWTPRELELERYLVTNDEDGPLLLSESVFGEPLLLLSNQVRTRHKKRADILAIDRLGNGVIVELKRDQGRLGVETQALQYLADFSAYSGKGFLRKFRGNANVSEETLLSFIGGNADIEDINVGSRIILVARSFDPTLFSMGEWLSSKGVSFRCITYVPVEISGRKYLSFSVVFDRSAKAIYPLSFASAAREPGYFWHNIARADQRWWNFLVENNQIPACFEDSPGDQGEKILTSYVPGDTIVAYAKGFGAVGWGVVASPVKYRLLAAGDKGDLLGGCRHRLQVNWKCTTKSLSDGVAPDVIREKFEIYHPISISNSINPRNCIKLIEYMNEIFGT